LRRIPRVVAVSGGKRKTAAIHAALLARFCTCLVTDAVAARGVLQMEAERRGQRVVI
jgi:DNA-binding transcriptional regulator LsrR (DeoR family)